jgi:hypothetical protein
MFADQNSPILPTLHGFTEDGCCTLCQLVEADSPNVVDFVAQQSIKAKTYRALACLTGMCINSVAEAPSFVLITLQLGDAFDGDAGRGPQRLKSRISLGCVGCVTVMRSKRLAGLSRLAVRCPRSSPR